MMEHQKALNLLNEENDSKFVTRKWNNVIDLANANFDVANEIIYNIEVLKSNLCHCNDAFILVKGDITIKGHQVTQLAFKNCAPFIKCITKIDGATIDEVEYLDLVMLMYNIIKSSSNYSETARSLWFYLKTIA